MGVHAPLLVPPDNESLPLAERSQLSLHAETLNALIDEITTQIGRLIEDAYSILGVDLQVGKRYIQILTEEGDWLRVETSGDRNVEREYLLPKPSAPAG